jgi:hypothetical protein
MELQLIQLYLWVCLVYDKHPMLKYQRLSNNWQPDFTDQELITIYLFGHFQGHFKQKRIYDYISQHFLNWFPELPSYQAFNRRLNLLGEPLKMLVFELMTEFAQKSDFYAAPDCVIDSLPIMLAVRSRSSQAKVATDNANVGYCASKDIFYHGVKLHILARKECQSLPLPEILTMTKASEHDLPVLQGFEGKTVGNLFADKAYRDQRTEQVWAENGVIICTPDKKRKNTEIYEVGKSGLWSRFVSAMRQPIESLFNWIIEKTDIQNGSKIRSGDGLFIHCYGKLAASLFILCFNP